MWNFVDSLTHFESNFKKCCLTSLVKVRPITNSEISLVFVSGCFLAEDFAFLRAWSSENRELEMLRKKTGLVHTSRGMKVKEVFYWWEKQSWTCLILAHLQSTLKNTHHWKLFIAHCGDFSFFKWCNELILIIHVNCILIFTCRRESFVDLNTFYQTN